MLFRIFYFLTAIETFLLSAYLAWVGSEEAGAIFNLSLLRLTAVAASLLIGFFLLYLGAKPLFKKEAQSTFETRLLNSEKKMWLVLCFGLLIVGVGLFLLTRQINAFGDYKLIYQKLEPVLVWLVVLGAQIAFFSVLCICAKFTHKNDDQYADDLDKELLPLFGLFAVFLLLKLVFVSATAYGPLGRGDEMTYYDMADALYRGFFSPKDSNHYPPLYPLSLVITMVFKGWTFEGIKLLNAIFSSSLIFPVYFIARNHLDARKSLLTAFLSCLIPYHMVFPRRILSENLFFPLFFWTMFVTYVQPKNKNFRLPWDLVNGALIGALYLTRYITLATIPFFALSWWVKPFTDEKGLFKPGAKKTKHFVAFSLAMLAIFSPWLISGLREGVPLKLLLGFGITSRTTEAQLTFSRLMVWALLYACYFVLLASPVLHILILSLRQIDYKQWRYAWGRWVFQTAALMLGFYMAVVRHSWRAFYNADLPSAIMGRYLIVFSPAYFIIAMITIDNFKLEKVKKPRFSLLSALVLSFGLVVFSHLTLIAGAIVPTDGDLLKSLGSVDAFFTEILGASFFLLLFMIYGFTGWFLYQGKRRVALAMLTGGLIIYYAAGMPAYFNDLMNYQTYPYLAKQISRMLPLPDAKSGVAERVTVFLPEERTVKSGVEIYNGLRTRGFIDTVIKEYSEEALEQMETDLGFVILQLPDKQSRIDMPIFEINGLQFQIIRVEKQEASNLTD